MKKGLCFRCREPWASSHKCRKRNQINRIEATFEKETEESHKKARHDPRDLNCIQAQNEGEKSWSFEEIPLDT